MDMSDITGLVRSGRLGEATDAIRRRLGSGAGRDAGADGPADGRGAAHTMRDVTPPPAVIAPPPGAERPRRPASPRAARPGRTERLPGPMAPLLTHPAVPAAEAPLVVMLHGCTQTPEDFARGTRMDAVAGAHGAYVLWPGQTRAANANGCWNWFEAAHQGARGETAALAALAQEVLGRTGADPRRLHVAGLSAGGAMAAVLAAARPDIVASIGIHSGLGAGAASDMPSAFAAMGGRGAAPSALRVPAIVIHGDADRTVVPANAAAIAAAGREGGSPRPRRRLGTEGGRGFARTAIPAGPGAEAVELVEVQGLGHAWSGGATEGSHTDPAGPDASAMIMRFFLDHPRRG